MEEELTEAIEIVADQLGIAVEHIYGVFVHAQSIIGAISLCLWLVVALTSVWFMRRVYTILQSHYTDGAGNWDSKDDPIWVWVGSMVAGLVFLVMCGIVVSAVSSALLKILCPEYTAIREILSLVMGG